MSKNIIFTAGIALGLVLGAGGMFWREQRLTVANTAPSVSGESEPALREKFQALFDTELKDYERLKSMEEKYRKADEIFGKVINILLADLGIKISPAFRDRLHRDVTGRVDDQAREAVKAPDPCPAAPVVAKAGEKTEEKSSAPISLSARGKAVEKRLDEIRSEEDAMQALSDAKIQGSPLAFLNSSGDLVNPAVLAIMNGTFTGQARVTIEERPQTWDVRLHMDAKIVGQDLSGNAGVVMSNGGRVFSESGENGTVSGIREFASGTKALVVRASPTDFFQVYYLSQMNALAGNVYKKTTRGGDFTWIGTLFLRKN